MIPKRIIKASAFLIFFFACSDRYRRADRQTAFAQSTGQQPTRQQTAEFIRGKLLSLAPRDGKHDYSDVTLSVCYIDLRFKSINNDTYLTIDFSRLDPSALTWEVAGTEDQNKVLLLTLVSKDRYGLRYNTPDDIEHKVTYPLAFSFIKAADVPDFQKRMTDAVKHMIFLCARDERG
jgi:hypothetical protein